jgi:hypothetical protein
MMTIVRKLAALTTAWSASAKVWTPEINCRTRGQRHRFAVRAPEGRRPRLRQTPGIDEVGKPLVFNLHSKAVVAIVSRVLQRFAGSLRSPHGNSGQAAAKPLDRAHVHDNAKWARSRVSNRDNDPAYWR